MILTLTIKELQRKNYAKNSNYRYYKCHISLPSGGVTNFISPEEILLPYLLTAITATKYTACDFSPVSKNLVSLVLF